MKRKCTTGSGKTCAFLVPLLDRLASHSTDFGARGVVLSPTRELAMQTLKFAKGLAKFTDLRFALLVGGDSMEMQFSALANNPDIIIATPGRLMHQLQEVPDFRMNRVDVVVFDECDRLFEMGYVQACAATSDSLFLL
jgi:ATP-dependent RNA helicase DDX54/DBP10